MGTDNRKNMKKLARERERHNSPHFWKEVPRILKHLIPMRWLESWLKGMKSLTLDTGEFSIGGAIVSYALHEPRYCFTSRTATVFPISDGLQRNKRLMVVKEDLSSVVSRIYLLVGSLRYLRILRDGGLLTFKSLTVSELALLSTPAISSGFPDALLY